MCNTPMLHEFVLVKVEIRVRVQLCCYEGDLGMGEMIKIEGPAGKPASA